MTRAGRFHQMLAVFVATIAIAAAASSAPSAHASNLKLKEVGVKGVTKLTPDELDGAIELEGGDVFEKSKAVHSIENIQALYRLKGYEEVEVKTELVSKKVGATTGLFLDFDIHEGRPTRVMNVQFIAGAIPNDSSRKIWDSIQRSLVYKIGVTTGDILDQDRITATKRIVQDVLAAEEFVGAKVDDIRVIQAPKSNAPDFNEPTGRWVVLEYRVELGDRVSFGFRGNHYLSSSRLTALVDEQRLVGFGKDFVGAIRERIEEEYRSSGFADARVTAYTFEKSKERHVTYSIDEGPRFRLGEVSFDGALVFSNDQLRELFFNKGSALVQNRYYVEKDVQRAADLVVEWMKSKGYLSAKVVTINTSRQRSLRPEPTPEGRAPKLDRVSLVIYLYEGDQTLVRDVAIQGASAISTAEIKRTLGLEENQPLNLFALSEGVEALRAEYGTKGYLNMKIANESSEQVIRYSRDGRHADIQLEIDEGPQFHAGKITIEGLSQTHENVIRRELALGEGDVLDETRVAESEASLRKLGIFSSSAIRLTDDPESPDRKNIRISVQEGTPGVIAGGVGIRNDLGVRVFGQTAYTNIGGRNHTAFFNVSANRRFPGSRRLEVEGQGQLGYIWPWFLGDEMTFRPTFTLGSVQYRNFDITSGAVALTLERKIIKRDPSTTLALTYSLERTRQFHVQNPRYDEQELRIGALIPAVSIDSRDNPLSPSRGFFGTASMEFAHPAFFSQTDPFPVGYTRFQMRTDYIVPLSRDVSWFLSFRSGLARNLVLPTSNPKSGAIPLSKQFSLGGASSLRGFGLQEINFQDQAISGTLAYTNYRTQLDLPFSGGLRFGPFLDAGNLLIDRYSLGMLRYGAGFGFHYQTPVGPINLDLGFKLFRREGENPSEFYFSVGLI